MPMFTAYFGEGDTVLCEEDIVCASEREARVEAKRILREQLVDGLVLIGVERIPENVTLFF